MLKREWGAESNGKLSHLSIPSKTAAWVPEFAVEDLPFSRTATLVPEFAVKDLPLGRILMMIHNSINIRIHDFYSFWKRSAIKKVWKLLVYLNWLLIVPRNSLHQGSSTLWVRGPIYIFHIFLPPLYLRHSSFYSPSVASPTSWALHLRHSSFSNPSAALLTSQLILQPFRCFTYVIDTSPASPGEPLMRTSQKFTTGVKYQFHQGFWPDQKSQSPFGPNLNIHT